MSSTVIIRIFGLWRTRVDPTCNFFVEWQCNRPNIEIDKQSMKACLWDGMFAGSVAAHLINEIGGK
jgi:hypothetical protein